MKQTEPAFAWPSLPPSFVRAPARLRLLSRQVEPCAINKVISSPLAGSKRGGTYACRSSLRTSSPVASMSLSSLSNSRSLAKSRFRSRPMSFQIALRCSSLNSLEFPPRCSWRLRARLRGGRPADEEEEE